MRPGRFGDRVRKAPGRPQSHGDHPAGYSAKVQAHDGQRCRLAFLRAFGLSAAARWRAIRWLRDPRIDEHPPSARLYRIAGTPVVTGLYTVLLPLVGFARLWVLPSSGGGRRLGHRCHFFSLLSRMATPSSEKYMTLVGIVALLTAGLLLFSAGLQTRVSRRFPLTYRAGRVSHRCRVPSRHRNAG
jgi:hypothetical protein